MDNVPTLAIQLPIVQKIPEMLSPTCVCQMSKEDIRKIAGESNEDMDYLPLEKCLKDGRPDPSAPNLDVQFGGLTIDRKSLQVYAKPAALPSKDVRFADPCANVGKVRRSNTKPPCHTEGLCNTKKDQSSTSGGQTRFVNQAPVLQNYSNAGPVANPNQSAIIRNNPSDQEAQLALAHKWIKASGVLAALLPDQEYSIKAREGYIFDAYKMLEELIAAQNADAMFYLAEHYRRDFPERGEDAFSLYLSAAKADHAAAAYHTAVCYEEGSGIRKDIVNALQWYIHAAVKLHNLPAMYKLGMIWLKGLLGQPKNLHWAIKWLKRAADRADAENPHALHELGLLYESEQPTDGSSPILRDEAYALSLFQQAAKLGYKFSQFRLGCVYEYGLFNLPSNPDLSIMWYSRAAVQGEHYSELALSGWYLTGCEGVLQQSDAEAYLWARKAAEAGLAKAEYVMGYFTEIGIGPGTRPDLVGGMTWYRKAAGT
jgi:TPR repeat protein